MIFLNGRLLLTALLLTCASAQAQIYVCTAADGTRVFSDEKCGPDAKVVKGISNRKRPAPKTAASAKAAKTPPKTASELQDLLTLCNAGDTKSCTTWTHGGGPNQLREEERKAESACEGGSLPDCELRYCRDGASDQCRTHILQTAMASGDTWYLRANGTRQAEGPTAYSIRCMREGTRETRDATIICSATPGPARCRDSNSQQAFPQLSQAASSHCSAQH